MKWLLFAALLLGAAWWLRRKPDPDMKARGWALAQRLSDAGRGPERWPLQREGDDGIQPVDPWPQSQTYTFPDGTTFLIGESVRR
jgi:hypothetical protein